MNDPEMRFEPVSEKFDTTPPIEESKRLQREARAARQSKLEAAKATHEANQKLGISQAPEPIKKRYPDLRRLEAEAAQTKLFPEPNEPATPVDQ